MYMIHDVTSVLPDVRDLKCNNMCKRKTENICMQFKYNH